MRNRRLQYQYIALLCAALVMISACTAQKSADAAKLARKQKELADSGKYKEAAEAGEALLKLYDDLYEETHPVVRSQLTTLALLYEEQEDWNNAAQTWRDLIDIERSMPKDKQTALGYAEEKLAEIERRR